ncbi:MAG: site-2 protease family protein, partial [Nitrospinae bacterium]|nr:site-2 protease family protein [Nitrospinota bacterium]
MFSSDLLIAVPAILLALTFHEVAHGWMADKLGDNTARMLGRLNLNPIVHLDPLGTLAFVISMVGGVGFGWAKPVPVNPGNFRHPRRGMMWVALAGPATNFILAIISGFLFSLLRGSGMGFTFVGEPLML